MNRMIFVALVLSASISLLLQAQGNATGECSNLVERAFEVAGVNDQIAALPAQIQSQLETQLQRDSKLGDAEKQKVAGIFNTAFLPDNVGRSIQQEFLKSCDLEMLRTVIAGLTNPLGEKMRGMEAFVASPQGSRQMAEYAGTLAQRPPARERLILIQRMDNSLGIAGFAVETLLATFRGLGAAFGGLPTDGSLESSMRTQISEPMHSGILVSLVFTYREASDQELTQYIELYETPAFKRFNDRFKKAFLDAIAHESQKAGLEMKKLTDASATSRK